jgi:copper resistance protein B
MAQARHHVLSHHGDTRQFYVMADRFERQSSDESDALVWDGGDMNRLWPHQPECRPAHAV